MAVAAKHLDQVEQADLLPSPPQLLAHLKQVKLVDLLLDDGSDAARRHATQARKELQQARGTLGVPCAATRPC